MINKIIPSVRLKVVSVHKLQGFKCWRKYFWRWILNLEPRKMSFAFWYGGVLHAGFEALLLGKNPTVAMKKESRRRTSRYNLSGDDREEIALQMRLLQACVAEAARQPWVKKCKLKWAERQFCLRLEKSGLLFCSTLDGRGVDTDVDSLFEIKTAKSVTNDYFTALTFDMQIHGYGLQLREKKEKCPRQCTYCVFRKPQRRVKKKQSVDAFVKEMTRDFKERADWYYIRYPHPLGRLTITETGKDVEAGALLLQTIYNKYANNELLERTTWPRNTSQCLSYGACPYLILCKYPKKWRLYLRLFQQRQMLYEEEKQELQT